MSDRVKAVLSNRLYVPKEYVSNYHLSQYTYNFTPEELEPYVVQTYREFSKYYGFSRGDLGKMYELFGDFEIEDQRAKPPMTHDIKWNPTKKLRTMQDPGFIQSDQQEVFDTWLEYGYGQIKAPCRWGKCVSENSLLPTDKGFLYMKDLAHNISNKQVEEKVFNIQSVDGIRSTSHVYNGGQSDTLKINTYFGYSINGTYEHPILCMQPDNSIVWKRLDELKVDDVIAIQKTNLWTTKDLLLTFEPSYKAGAKHYSYPKKMTKKLARLLGYLVSEGCTRRTVTSFCNADKEIFDDYVNCFYTCFKVKPNIFYRINPKTKVKTYYADFASVNIKRFLIAIGLDFVLSNDKQIPWSILQSKQIYMTNFLQAYYEGDGYPNWNNISAISASSKLMNQLQIVLLNYGIVSRRGSKYKTSSTGKTKLYYYITVCGRDVNTFYNKIGFISNRKNSFYFRRTAQNTYEAIPYLFDNIQKNINKNLGGGIYLINGERKKLKLSPEGKGNYTCLSVDYVIQLFDDKQFEDLNIIDPNLYKNIETITKFKDVQWLYISSIEKQKDSVVDLTVPVTHAFIANGFICHNTIMLSSLVCHLKVKTLIIAHQIELLNQFLEKFWEFTNISEFQDNPYDGPVAGHVYKWEDIEHLDIAVMAYQSFVTGKDAESYLAKYRDTWGAVFVDECFLSSAECYSQIINSLNPYYRLGVSATPKKKNGLHLIVEDVIGPVIAEGHTNQLKGDWSQVNTGYDPLTTDWVSLLGRLSRNSDRNQLIVRYVIKDIANGHNIAIGLWRKEQIIWLTELLKAEGIAAEAFHGSAKDRPGIIERARSGETRVIVAYRKMLLGIDVPRWSAYYSAGPINDPYVFHQELSRVRTPFFDEKGNSLKPRPLVRLFCDASRMCFAMNNTCKAELISEGFTQIFDDARIEFNKNLITPNVGITKSYKSLSTDKVAVKFKCKECKWFEQCKLEFEIKATTKACTEFLENTDKCGMCKHFKACAKKYKVTLISPSCVEFEKE